MRILTVIIFVTAVLLISCLGHRYAWKRLIRDPGLDGRWRRAGTILFLGGALLLPLAQVLGRTLSRDAVGWLSLLGNAWMGVMAFALAHLLILDTPRGLRALGRKLRRKPAQAADAERRQFLARTTAGVVGASSVSLFAIGTANAFADVEVEHIAVPLPRLPKQLDGFKIAQISDVHIGPLLDGRFLDRIVEKVNAMKPDLVVVTGDLVDGTPKALLADVSRLRRIQSRYGGYFVTGNHEYYSDCAAWLPELEKLGLRVLTNQTVTVGDDHVGGASFDLSGIPDRTGHRYIDSHVPDLKAALAGHDPDRARVLLAHRPNPIVEAAKHRVGLQLSGHTHGGQFFPVTVIAELVHPYNRGLHQHSEDTWIYVSRGAGFWGPPVRLAAPSEITELILTA